MTIEAAIETAKNELSRAIYLSESSRSAGIRAINEEKADWLNILIWLAEKECERRRKEK